MERFLTRYVLPPLARTIQLEALAANQRALLLLRDGGDGLDAALAAGRACWWLLRPALPEGRWRSVRDSLAGQRALARRSPLPRRRLARTLERQSAWLGELTGAPPAADGPLLDRLAQAYRKARRQARRDPTSAGLRQRLARLVLCEELLLPLPGPMMDGPMPGLADRRRLLETLCGAGGAGPARGGRARGSKGRRRAGAAARLAARAFEQRPADYRAELPRCLQVLGRPQPVALTPPDGRAPAPA